MSMHAPHGRTQAFFNFTPRWSRWVNVTNKFHTIQAEGALSTLTIYKIDKSLLYIRKHFTYRKVQFIKVMSIKLARKVGMKVFLVYPLEWDVIGHGVDHLMIESVDLLSRESLKTRYQTDNTIAKKRKLQKTFE